jgi:RNA polymerase sigma factor (sigma-70 family)
VKEGGSSFVSASATDEDDETLNLRIQCKEPDALNRLLELYGPRATGYLAKHYRALSKPEIKIAVHNAVTNAWLYGHTFDPSRSLKSWFLRIVQNEAIDIINDKQKHAGVEFDPELHDRSEDCDDPISEKAKQRIKDLELCIEKLAPLQKAIIREDLESSDVAGAERLAEKLGTTTNSIYVSRGKARDNLHKCIADQENQRRPRKTP